MVLKKGPNFSKKSITVLIPEDHEYLKYLKMFICFPVWTVIKPGEPPFPEIRLAIGQTTTKSYMSHIICYELYDSQKPYELHWNLQWLLQSAPRSHLIVAAWVTLTKLNRVLLTGERQARLRQATRRIASAYNKLSNSYVRLVHGWFYANSYCWSFQWVFFLTDRSSDLLNFRFIIFKKYFPFLKVWLIINISHSLWWVFILENAKILSDHDFIHE